MLQQEGLEPLPWRRIRFWVFWAPFLGIVWLIAVGVLAAMAVGLWEGLTR